MTKEYKDQIVQIHKRIEVDLHDCDCFEFEIEREDYSSRYSQAYDYDYIYLSREQAILLRNTINEWLEKEKDA